MLFSALIRNQRHSLPAHAQLDRIKLVSRPDSPYFEETHRCLLASHRCIQRTRTDGFGTALPPHRHCQNWTRLACCALQVCSLRESLLLDHDWSFSSPSCHLLARRLYPDLIWPVWHVAHRCFERCGSRIVTATPQWSPARTVEQFHGRQSITTCMFNGAQALDRLPRCRSRQVFSSIDIPTRPKTTPLQSHHERQGGRQASQSPNQSVWHQLRVLACRLAITTSRS